MAKSVSIPPKKFRSYESRDASTVYQALSDGLALSYNSDNIQIGLTDSSNPPTIERFHTHCANDDNTPITMPVLKGDYWKITSTNAVVWWVPLK